MPDAGDFDRNKSHAQLPRDWGSAFAAMPLETPDADGWQRVQARLPAAAPATRTRWPLWLAMAASLALAVALPLRMQPDTVQVAATDVAPTPVSTLPAALAGKVDTESESDAIAGQATIPPVRTSAAPARPTTAPSQVAARRATPARRAVTPPSQRPVRTLAHPEGDTRIAAAVSGADLEPLYAQSAQLEGLLALARDDRVSSGPAAALTEDLDAQVASIDAALIQPDLPSQRRTELWGERVDTLRQLVGVEATQRLLAARGQQYDAALVSID